MPDRKLIAALVAGLILSGCAGRYVRIGEKGMTCAEAHNNAMATVSRLGFVINDFKKPVPGSPGIITGTRSELAGGGSVFVQVFCTDMGAEIEAKAEGEGLGGVNFAQQFQSAFDTVSSRKVPVRAAAATGVDVLLKLENATGPELGADISGTGVLPVSVRISNQTKTTYKFRPSGVNLIDTLDTGHAPLSLKDATAKMQPAQIEVVKKKALGDATIKPGETVTGYVFAPFLTYSRARVSLVDQANEDEEEGFAIDF